MDKTPRGWIQQASEHEGGGHLDLLQSVVCNVCNNPWVQEKAKEVEAAADYQTELPSDYVHRYSSMLQIRGTIFIRSFMYVQCIQGTLVLLFSLVGVPPVGDVGSFVFTSHNV